MNQETTNRLFKLIARINDNSNALSLPSAKTVEEWLIEAGVSVEIISDVAAKRQAATSIHAARSDLAKAFGEIVTSLCQNGNTLEYNYNDDSSRLVVSLVERETHTGMESVWGVYNRVDGNEYNCEYVHARCIHSLFRVISWRMFGRPTIQKSPFGYTDPIVINQDSE